MIQYGVSVQFTSKLSSLAYMSGLLYGRPSVKLADASKQVWAG